MKVETFDSCPCCGGEFRDADHPKAILHLVTVGVQRSILRELITHFPEFVPKERLVQSVYGYRGPDNADGNVEVFILHLRRRIAETKFVIRSSRGVGYRLERKGAASMTHPKRLMEAFNV